MASLSSLIGKFSSSQIDETNLEKGKIFLFTPGTMRTNFYGNIMWRAPATGTAEIEAWGAAGSGSRMCCCGLGLPGNTGAYVKKTVRVNPNSWVCGFTGFSCGNADRLCWRECSQATCVRICSTEMSTPCVCMCAQGGMAGFNLCNCDNCSYYGKYVACNFCGTECGTGCGLICNCSSTYSHTAQAYGGDINWNGEFSCLFIGACNTCCTCCFISYVRVPPGIYGTQAQTIEFQHQPDGERSGWNNGPDQYYMHAAGMRSSPNMSMPIWTCYSGAQWCQCYEWRGCGVYQSPAVPGPSFYSCSSIRTHGMRGGHGMIKIKFIAD